MNCYIHTVLFETKNMIKVLSRVCVLHVLSSRVMFHAAALFCSSDVKQKKDKSIILCYIYGNWKNPGCLVYRGDFITQLYGDWTNQYKDPY